MKTILITGASSGFGLATAHALAQDNRLVLISKERESVEKLKGSFADRNLVHCAQVDIRNKEQVEKFFEELPSVFRSIDVLINNAGLATTADPIQTGKLEDWETMVDTNIKGLLNITHAALPLMLPRQIGVIINIGSCAAHIPYKGGNVYGATKAFVRQFSRNLRLDLFGTGIKVTNIEPGAAETNFSVVRFGSKQKADEYYKDWRPLRPEDIAKTIAWILDQPAHVNIDSVEIMPLDQAPAGMTLNKKQHEWQARLKNYTSGKP